MRRAYGIAGLLLVWELAARWAHSPLFPPVSKTLWALWKLLLSGELSKHIAVSLLHVGLGYSIAVCLGLSLGILVTHYGWARDVIMPVVDTMRPIAALTLFPLLITILGLGVWSKAFVIMWTSWPAVILNTIHGIETVDKEVLEAAQLDGANRLNLLWHIILPLGMPTIVTGLRIGLSGGYISLVSAEMLGSSAGLGYAILAYSQTFRFPEMYAIIIVIAGIGLAMNIVLGQLQEVSNESTFYRFGDRAASFGLDGLRTFFKRR